MSYHTLTNNYISGNSFKLNGPCLVVTDNYRFDSGNVAGNILQLPGSRFEYESFAKRLPRNDEKQLIKETKIADSQWANKSTGRTIKGSTITEQRKNFVQNHLTLQENLTKTVKHTSSSYKKPQVNSNTNESLSSYSKFQYKPKRQQLGNYHQLNTPEFYQTNLIIKQQPKNTIMSIQEIRQLQQKQLDNKMIVHKITPSSSRQKLKTSSSKDSKGDAGNNVEKRIGMNGGIAERYNKYINDGLIMGVNFDLKKQMMNNVQTPTNPNVKMFGQLSSENRFKELYAGHQRVMSDLEQFSTYGNQKNTQCVDNNKSRQLIAEKTLDKDQPLTCRQSIPRQDKLILTQKFKYRSKSNLSKYTQMKSILQKQALSNINLYQNESLQKPAELLRYQTPQRLELQVRHDAQQNQKNEKNEKKIHVLNYSSVKNKAQQKPEKENHLIERLQPSLTNNQNEKQAQIRESEYRRYLSSGISISSQSKKGSQTERKAPQREKKNDNFQHIGLMMQEKLSKKPIRLTLQRRN